MKTFRKAPRDPRAAAMIEAEAHGLEFLRGRSPLRVPAVLERGADFLVLEHLEIGSLHGASAEAFGHGLAELHRSGAPSYALSSWAYVSPSQSFAVMNTADSTGRVRPALRIDSRTAFRSAFIAPRS